MWQISSSGCKRMQAAASNLGPGPLEYYNTAKQHKKKHKKNLKIDPKSTKIRPKWPPKWLPNRLLEGSGGLLEGSGGQDVLSWPQDGSKRPKGFQKCVRGPPLDPPSWNQNRQKIYQNFGDFSH